MNGVLTKIPRAIAAAVVCVAFSNHATARNVDLSTVPERDTVQLTIYNTEDLTLVRETRTVCFKRGDNPLQFSWAGTRIDPTSVELRFLTDPEKFEVLDTTFPHDKPQMLYWNVQSEIDGEATIEITYFTSGITWSADYVCVAETSEKTVSLDGFVRVANNSGEEYEDAQVRLVVGRINLVEKIAELAQIPVSEVTRLAGNRKEELRQRGLRVLFFDADAMALDKSSRGRLAEVEEQLTEKQIIKEGLSEYFIYTIEGTETIPNGWSKRMRSLTAADVPLKIQYRYREAEYGPRLVRMYLLQNDEKSNLGTTPLPDGLVRAFRDNGRDGLTYLTSQPIKYLPIGDKLELNLGVDPDVRFELIATRTWRNAIWMHVDGTDLYHQVGAANVQIDVRSSVAGWDSHTAYAQRIRNFTEKPIEVEIRRVFPGHVVFSSQLGAKLHDYCTVEFRANIAAGEKRDLAYKICSKEGRNKKQDNVTLAAD